MIMSEKVFTIARSMLYVEGLSPKMSYDAESNSVIYNGMSEAMISSFEEKVQYLSEKENQQKLLLDGFLYGGKTLSATDLDLQKLSSALLGFSNSIIDKYQASFENGEGLLITSENYIDFTKKFTEFRNSVLSNVEMVQS